MTVKVKPKIPKGAINSSETIQDKIRNEYVIFSGLTINTRGYFCDLRVILQTPYGQVEMTKTGQNVN